MTYSTYTSSAATSGLIGGTTIHVMHELPSGHSVGVTLKKDEEGEVNPRLYFKLVKGKLTTLEMESLQKKIDKLLHYLHQSEQLGQVALAEQLSQQFTIATRQQELVVCGYTKVVSKKFIDLFLKKCNLAKLTSLENFARVIPKYAMDAIKDVKERKLFDSIVVLHLDNKKDSADKKTHKQKVIEKDPIAFGLFSYDPDSYYFIEDWIDEYCDLTLEKFIETIKEDTPDYEMEKIPAVTRAYADSIKRRVLEQHERLQNTNRETWRAKALEAEREELKKLPAWKRVLKKFVNKITQ
jgi:folate-dependent phosphoribosylglycinamide formyltransferase PurN